MKFNQNNNLFSSLIIFFVTIRLSENFLRQVQKISGQTDTIKDLKT